ncbi:MAG: signal recognition particle protein [Lachnospiraceae bacterium]|nr:signal recognition particle protein [Lachnospiraceae bacterium]
MAFESLADKLQNTFKKLTDKGLLTEADVKSAMREVKLALLEADVNYKVVKDFVKRVEERAVGTEVMNSLTPGQQVIKIVNEELIASMGGEPAEIKLQPRNEITVFLMAGLQGSGKTTSSAKLAAQLRKKKDRNPLLVACDIYRPAAIDQLKRNGEKLNVPVFAPGTNFAVPDIARMAMKEAEDKHYNLVILDTAGRLHIDDAMMEELEALKETVPVTQTLLVVDAMTGQDAVNVATSFNDRIGIDGVILTKLDGDARGGAALSVRSVTGKPILYAGMGEKLEDLEAFNPVRMANRILGMGDVLSLIEKAQNADLDEQAAQETYRKIKKNEFDLEDFLTQMRQMNKMGGIGEILKMLPGMGGKLKNTQLPDDKSMKHIEAIILSMTPDERRRPDRITPPRKRRIANGSGTTIQDVNRLLKQFDQSRQMMKQMSGNLGKGKKGRMPFKLPF